MMLTNSATKVWDDRVASSKLSKRIPCGGKAIAAISDGVLGTLVVNRNGDPHCMWRRDGAGRAQRVRGIEHAWMLDDVPPTREDDEARIVVAEDVALDAFCHQLHGWAMDAQHRADSGRMENNERRMVAIQADGRYLIGSGYAGRLWETPGGLRVEFHDSPGMRQVCCHWEGTRLIDTRHRGCNIAASWGHNQDCRGTP